MGRLGIVIFKKECSEKVASTARSALGRRGALPATRTMPRTVSTCHLLPVSVEEYLVIRSDPAYEAYKADLAHQELHISKSRSAADDRADPTRWRSVEIHFRENPVPAFLRSLVNTLIGKEIRRAMDGRIDSR